MAHKSRLAVRGEPWIVLAFTAVLSFNAAAGPVACPAGGVDITKAPYLAKNDGSADVSAAFSTAVNDPKVRTICLPRGEYLFTDHVFLRTGQELALLGLSTDPRDAKISWKTPINPFHSSPLKGLETRIKGFTVTNVTFDGNRTDGRAFNLLASPPAGGPTYVEISNTIFQNTTNLPIWVEGFSRVKITGSKFLNTKDPGILRSSNVEIVSNEVENSSDNCMSVSRGNTNVIVAHNRFRNCHSAGIFVGGINYKGDAKNSLTLDASPGAAAGSTCKLTSSEQEYFRYGMIDTNLTVKQGDNYAIVKITGWDPKDHSHAPCELVTPAPPALLGRKTSDWFDGPHFGGENATIEDNVIEGSLGHGITLSLGARNVRVVGNTVKNSGRFVNADGSVQTNQSFGMLVLGWYLGKEPGAHRYAENIEIVRNVIAGPTAGGIRLGSEQRGGVRNIAVRDNKIDLSSGNAHLGILVDNHPDMESSHNTVVGNEVIFNPATAHALALRVDAPAAQACGMLSEASVPRMVGGECAIHVENGCQAKSSPAQLRCDVKRPRVQ
jgi:hypothetical protein